MWEEVRNGQDGRRCELSVTKGNKHDESKLEVSNPYLRQRLEDSCREEGLWMDRSIDYFGIDKRTGLGGLGSKVAKKK